MTARIRWSDDGTEGYVGTVGQRIFTLYPPQDGGEWMMAAALPGFNGRIKYRDTLEELHPDAEQWLSETVSSLGAIFPPEPADDESQRWQVEEARKLLAAWDEQRNPRGDIYSTERALADQVRTLLAIIEPAKEAGQP
jgi:hypothetical protein